jgi:serine/threonine-protein kinase HipA
MADSSTLTLWMNGLRVGAWSVRRGIHILKYDPTWIASSAGRPLSLSLPFTPENEPIRGARVENYFDNLLPDAATIRNRLRSKFATDSTEAFDLVKAIGQTVWAPSSSCPATKFPPGLTA